MKMKRILLEITLDRALQVLGISATDANDPAKLKAAYRSASLKAHPDRGGSTSIQQDVNAAYELLQKGAKSAAAFATSRSSYDNDRKEYFDLGIAVVRSLKEKLNLTNFLKHFKTIYGDEFQFKLKNESPKADIISFFPHDAFLAYEFFNDSRDIVFSIDFRCSLVDVKYDRSLGSGKGNISYPLGVIAYGFFNNKKLKITQRDYVRTQNHDVLSDPELSFPTKRLETFKKTASSKQFRREDMILTLKNKIDGGQWYDNQFSISLSERNPRMTLIFQRGTFQRMPYWDVNFYIDRKYERIERVGVLQENEATARFLIELANGAKKQPLDNVVSWLNREIVRYKQNKG